MTPDWDRGVSPPGLRLRPAGSPDIAPLAELCRRAIRATGPSGYDPEQVEAWAAFTADASAFRSFVLDHRTWVAEMESAAAGFAGLGSDGYVASLYVDPRWSRRGIGAALLGHLLAVGRREGVTRFHAAASRVALPVFLRAGFQVETEEMVDRGGVALPRYRVALAGGDA